MKLAILFFCLNILSNSWASEQSSSNLPSIRMELQFSNATGTCVNQASISTFIYAVNLATSRFGNDTLQHLNFIRNYMNAIQGNSSENYMVFLQRYGTPSAWNISSINGCNWASLTNINTKFTGWSYMFARVQLLYKQSYSYIPYVGKGSGMTPEVQNVINYTVLSIEKSSLCFCEYMNEIQKKLIEFYGGTWNILCNNSYDMIGFVFAKNNQWIYTKPYMCFYMIYVT